MTDASDLKARAALEIVLEVSLRVNRLSQNLKEHLQKALEIIDRGGSTQDARDLIQYSLDEIRVLGK